MRTLQGTSLAAAVVTMFVLIGCSSERIGPGEGSSNTEASPGEGDGDADTSTTPLRPDQTGGGGAGSSTTAAGQYDGKAAGAAVEDWLSALVPWGFRGAVAVLDGGEPLVLSGFGGTDSTGDGMIGVDTRFPIGSNTKPITALAILLLEDRGLVDVDDGRRLYDRQPGVHLASGIFWARTTVLL